MIDPQEEISNLEQDLRDLGWRPVEMVEPNTGVPFTRWFPPTRDAPPDVSLSEETTPDAGDEQR